MKYSRDSGGNLVMTPDVNDAKNISWLSDIESTATENEWLIENGFEVLRPEDVGALTGAPIISWEGDVFGYMNYAVTSFLMELAAGREVTWQKG